MRTLTVYICSHAEEPPLAVFPTKKQAIAFNDHQQKEHGVCDNWHVEGRTFNDNSAGAASFSNWLLNTCEEMIQNGFKFRQFEEEYKKAKAGRDLMIGSPEVH